MVYSAPETAKSVASLLADAEFREESFNCPTDDDLRIAIHRFVERQSARKEQREENAVKPLNQQMHHESNDATLNQTIGIMNEKIYASSNSVHRRYHLLGYWTSVMFLYPFVLVIADLKRRLPHYLSDFVFEINQRRAQQKYLFASIFLIFTATLPAIVFGYIVERTTHGQIGVIECLFSQGVLGLGFALFSGQPLMVNMITGPTVVYIQVLMRWSDKLGFEFLPFYAWTGIWMGIFLILSGCLNTAALIPYLGRFTDEIFQTFIGFIFIQYWFTELIRITHHGYTYLLVPSIRNVFGDIGPSLAVLIVTGISYAFDPVVVERLDIRGPIGYSTTTGRPWIVPVGDLEVGYVFLAGVTGFLLFLVVFIDQNVCTYIVERPENRLRKGTAYSWNMVIVGILNIIASVLGMPWMYAGLPHSLLHVYALADVEERESLGRTTYRVIHAREVRIVGLVAYLFSFLIILAKPALDQLPIDVLYGFILFMGVASFQSNGLVERLILLFTQPERYPPSHIIRRVQRVHIHVYTLIQLFLVILLFFVAVNFYRGSTMFNTGLIFPFVLFLFIPFKFGLLYRWFPKREILALESGSS
ncbi:Sodium bicarbonate transporter-like protein 11 [Galdieria sulphuraria]|nr:Sodium bicarbonate transporter-like protein 11 [Galdieria sulphuraria]